MLCFTIGSGTLTSLISNIDDQNAEFQESLEQLNRLHQIYNPPLALYTKLKQSLKTSIVKDVREENEFFNRLPHNLQNELAFYMYEDTKLHVRFLRNKSKIFVNWLCPLLRVRVATLQENVTQEGDDVSEIYFLKSGNCSFVLPKHDNFRYIDISPGVSFGMHDILGYTLQHPENQIEDLFYQRDKIKRMFTIQAVENCYILTLSIRDLIRMQEEFNGSFLDIYYESQKSVQVAIVLKLCALSYC